MNLKKREDGFTLVELLVATMIGLIIMMAVYSMYRTQQKSFILQEQMAGMQQNLRAAMFYMAREIRMAGCDPTGNAGAGIISATNTSISFTSDFRGDANGSKFDGDINDLNESITYSFYDADGDGDMDIGRDTGDGVQPLAENIDALDLVYLNENGSPTSTISEIRSIQITIVARTGKGDQGYANTDGDFKNKQDQVIYTAPSDKFRRKMLTTNIRMRNL